MISRLTIFTICVLFATVIQAQESDIESLDDLRAATRTMITESISGGDLPRLVKERLVESGLSELDAERTVQSMTGEAADCVMAYVDEGLARARADGKHTVPEVTVALLEDQNSLSVAAEKCLSAALVNSGVSVE